LQAALSAAHGKVKDNSLETRNLQATLEAISHTSDEHKARGDRLEREKSRLDARVKELESELREAPQHLPTTTPNRRGISRPRSSSLSNFRLTSLEQDLLEARTSLATKDTELRTVHQKLSQVQNDLITADNEKLAMERKLKTEVGELQAFLEEKEEELDYLKEQQGDNGREEDLLRRIDEDDAKIEALEMMLRGAEDSKQLKEKLQRVEGQVCRERKHIAELEDRQIELIREKEEALDELEEARCNIIGLEQKLKDRDIRDHGVNER
jgi:chromosome segregation ATPase